jgi:tryptophan-rich sensory protein
VKSTVIIAGASAIIVAAAGAFLTKLDSWYRDLRKPRWQPPDWLFGPAWTVIFALSAFAGVLGWDGAPDRETQLVIAGLFALNAVLNMLWSILFFRLRRPDWALVETFALWLSIAAIMVALAPISLTASLAMLPYLLWVSFAGFLNLTIVRLNRPFARVRA